MIMIIANTDSSYNVTEALGKLVTSLQICYVESRLQKCKLTAARSKLFDYVDYLLRVCLCGWFSLL